MQQGFKSGRGGRRIGAGRPATGRTTKVIRVPNDCPDIDDLMATVEILKGWKIASDNASQTSPRWERLRELLTNVPQSIFDE